jgi:3-hydroxyacyl-[acyl-carrier-protein] dehydratase
MAGRDFPLSADEILPHRPPMLLIDRLVEGGGGEGLTETVIGRDHLFLEEGRLHPAALLEMMAQSFAAVKGLEDRKRGQAPARGFLVGVKGLHWYGQAEAGDRLRVWVKKVGETEEFVLAEARVEREGQVLAEGTIMVYVPQEAR